MQLIEAICKYLGWCLCVKGYVDEKQIVPKVA